MPVLPQPLTKEQLEAILDGQGHDTCPGVDIQFGIELRPATLTQPAQYGTLYQAVLRSKDPAAGMLAFHGGGFISGDPNGCGAMAKILALSLGVTTLSVSYRLATEFHPTYPFIGEDIGHAWQWLQQEASSLALHPHRIAVGGESAGATLAAHLAVQSPLVQPYANFGETPPPAALIALWGALDFVARWYDNGEKPGAERSLLGCNYPENPSRYHQASALTHARGSLPPALFIYGFHDPVVHARQGFLGLAAWQAAGAEAELLHLDNIGHGVIGDNRQQRLQLLEKIVAFSTSRFAAHA